MSPPINFLKLYRKRSPLTQPDIAYLLELSDYSNISRYEKGQRSPSIELLILYHLLFDTSIESFFEHHSKEMQLDLIKRIETLIIEINQLETLPKNTSRTIFLEQVINRLTK